MRVTVDKDSTILNGDSDFLVYRAQIKLSQVTRDGKLKIRFLAPISCSELVKKFKNESIRINLINEAE
jgi:hypothetical protein